MYYCIFILVYYIICKKYSSHVYESYENIKNDKIDKNVFISSTTSNFCCDIFEYSNNDILLIGYSHAFLL